MILSSVMIVPGYHLRFLKSSTSSSEEKEISSNYLTDLQHQKSVSLKGFPTNCFWGDMFENSTILFVFSKISVWVLKSVVVKYPTLCLSSKNNGIFSNHSSFGLGIGGITGASAFFFFFFFFFFLGLYGTWSSATTIFTFFPNFLASASSFFFSSSSIHFLSSSSSFALFSSSISSGVFFFFTGHFLGFGAFASSISFHLP